MESNAAIVRSVTRAMAQGEPLTVMALVTRDVVWNVHAADPDGAPWFGVRVGRRGIADLLDALASVTCTETAPTEFLADGDRVVTLAHLTLAGPDGTHLDFDEVQVWRMVDGKVAAVDVFLDTAAVAAALA